MLTLGASHSDFFLNFHVCQLPEAPPPNASTYNAFRDQYGHLRISRDLMHDTVILTLLASPYGIKADQGALERLEAEYDITDAVSIRGGFVFYQSGDKGLLHAVADNDRLFVVLKSSF